MSDDTRFKWVPLEVNSMGLSGTQAANVPGGVVIQETIYAEEGNAVAMVFVPGARAVPGEVVRRELAGRVRDIQCYKLEKATE